MNRDALVQLGVSVLLALGALGAALLVLAQPSAQARTLAATTRIYPGGLAPCNTSLQACINGSASGDSIAIQAGTYVTSITLNKAVNLLGAGSGTTVLRALTNQRVLTVTGAAITFTTFISGLTIAHGNAIGGACPAGCGGGIFLTGGAQPAIAAVVISGNVAGFDGGGIYGDAGSLILMLFSTVRSNASSNSGGGIYAVSDAILTDVTVQGNHTNGAGGGVRSAGMFAGTGLIVRDNTAGGSGGGAHVSLSVTLTSGQFFNNLCTGGGCNGGGLRALGGLVFINSTKFISNSATGLGGGVSATPTSGGSQIAAVRFERNSAGTNGGGLQLGGTDDVQLTQNTFISNSASADGGGLIAAGPVSSQGDAFNQNRAGGDGGGLMGLSGSVLVLTGTQFISNTSAGRGGGLRAGGSINATGAAFAANEAQLGGGLFADSQADLSASQFIANRATEGGGLLHNGQDARIVNSLFARNSISGTNGSGAAMSLNALLVNTPVAGHVLVLHNTIADTSLNPKQAINILSGTLDITDTIIVNFGLAIRRAGGSVNEDYNLFFHNTNNTTGGVTSGPHHVFADPLFANPAADNFHLRPVSPAIDAGFDAGVTTDFDGEPRPSGAGFDIGFDEVPLRVFLPLIAH